MRVVVNQHISLDRATPVRTAHRVAEVQHPHQRELAQEVQRWLDEHPLSLKKVSGTGKVINLMRAYVVPLVLALTIGVIGLVIALIMKK